MYKLNAGRKSKKPTDSYQMGVSQVTNVDRPEVVQMLLKTESYRLIRYLCGQAKSKLKRA